MPRYGEGRELIEFLDTAHLPERRRHRLDVDTYAASDCVYFFTVCARQHGDLFARDALAEAVVDALLGARRRHDWKLYAYCLMPDHLHFLVHLPDRDARPLDAGGRGLVPEGILDQIGRFKSYTTQLWWKTGGRGPLWQKSSYDKVIAFGDSIEAVAWYTLENPVRKGLVENWQDYRYSGIVDPWCDEHDHQDVQRGSP